MGPLDSSKIVRSKNNLNAFCAKDCNSSLNHDGKCHGACFQICPRVCKTLCIDGDILPPLPRVKPLVPSLVPPHPPSETGSLSQNNITATSMIIGAVSIGAVVLGCIFCAFLTVLYLRQRRERRERIPSIFFSAQEDFLDQDQEPAIDHHIWYINTIGLQQTVIDSIAVFKYKKRESLIEGTECSVCLNEFQEDDSLRLLPKCSHAFHIPCIDTWLRSNKNCPLCRAPVISNNFDVQVGLSVPASGDLRSRNEFRMENSENNGRLGEDGATEVRYGDTIEDETTDTNLNLSNHYRVQSDLAENRKTQEDAVLQPLRRSVSLDSSSAMAIRYVVANHIAGKGQENLPLKYSKSKNVPKSASSGNLNFGKLMRSSTIGRVAEGTIFRTLSSTLKSSSASLSRHSTSQDSILPL